MTSARVFFFITLCLLVGAVLCMAKGLVLARVGDGWPLLFVGIAFNIFGLGMFAITRRGGGDAG